LQETRKLIPICMKWSLWDPCSQVYTSARARTGWRSVYSWNRPDHTTDSELLQLYTRFGFQRN